jgi:hypothetical protein
VVIPSGRFPQVRQRTRVDMNVERPTINVGGKPSIGFSGRDEVFHEIALLVGGKFPESYSEFMRHVDGGRLWILPAHPYGCICMTRMASG